MSTDFRMHPGGSMLNVAGDLARLGQHGAFAGKIAEDFFGHHLLLTLKTEGVDTRFLTTAKAQSTLAFVAMEEGEPAFSFYGEGTVDSLLTADDVPETLHQETGILYVGSVSLLSGTRPATVLATVERLKGKALLSLDPNIGADLIHNEPKYRALLQRLIALTDILNQIRRKKRHYRSAWCVVILVRQGGKCHARDRQIARTASRDTSPRAMQQLLMREIAKLRALRAIGLPPDLFEQMARVNRLVSKKIV
jgi:pfkB family carbohydrate kinase